MKRQRERYEKKIVISLTLKSQGVHNVLHVLYMQDIFDTRRHITHFTNKIIVERYSLG
jgi:transcription initiation factor IIE alpha subunit